jgi:hypothetical protein
MWRKRTAEQKRHLHQRQLGMGCTKIGLDRHRFLEIPHCPAESFVSL